MCGFAGFISSIHRKEQQLEQIACSMALAIKERGPDDAGAWGEFNLNKHSNSLLGYGVAFGFRRLAIIDISSAGHQPMTSKNEQFIMVFNGEIYNHSDLRSLLPVSWTGHSDTETLLACFENFGVIETLKKTIGMFAIALWDKKQQMLHLARDRFGEKPLYYGWTGLREDSSTSFVFGSELKALSTYPDFNNPVSRDALTQYMRFNYVPTPYSIYDGIFKLEPGCLLSINANVLIKSPSLSTPIRPGLSMGGLNLQRWWSLKGVIEKDTCNVISSEVQAIELLEKKLIESVKYQSLADVPVGAFLSGGVDSSTIVSLMQYHTNAPIKTYTIGFEEASFDEGPYAKAVAKHLKTDHTEIYVSSKETQDIIPYLPDIYDEPFADSSQIPTHLVCKLAKKDVTVALTGDAGDELFGGYSRYIWAPHIWNHLRYMPFTLRHSFGSIIKVVPSGTWDFIESQIRRIYGKDKKENHFGDKVHKIASRLSSVRNINELYISLVTEWQDPSTVVKRNYENEKIEFKAYQNIKPSILIDDPLPDFGNEHYELKMMYRDTMSYLPDDILCKVDRASMATSLETRVPFLDHRVVEFAWQLPLNMKIRDRQGKWALRQVLYKYVPKELIDRPKAGFGIPINNWLRGPLREWAETLLNTKRIESEGYFYSEPIQQKWREHLSGRYDHTASLWAVLMFQSWLEKYRTHNKNL